MSYVDRLVFFWPEIRLYGWGWYAAAVCLQGLLGHVLIHAFVPRLSKSLVHGLLAAGWLLLLVPCQVQSGDELQWAPAAPVLLLSLLSGNRDDTLMAALAMLSGVVLLLLLLLLYTVPLRLLAEGLKRPHRLPWQILVFTVRRLFALGRVMTYSAVRSWTFITGGELLYLLRYCGYCLRLWTYYALALCGLLFRSLRWILRLVGRAARRSRPLLRRRRGAVLTAPSEQAESSPEEPPDASNIVPTAAGEHTESSPEESSDAANMVATAAGEQAESGPEEPPDASNIVPTAAGEHTESSPEEPPDAANMVATAAGEHTESSPEEPPDAANMVATAAGEHTESSPEEPSDAANMVATAAGEHTESSPEEPPDAANMVATAVGEHTESSPEEPPDTANIGADSHGRAG